MNHSSRPLSLSFSRRQFAYTTAYVLGIPVLISNLYTTSLILQIARGSITTRKHETCLAIICAGNNSIYEWQSLCPGNDNPISRPISPSLSLRRAIVHDSRFKPLEARCLIQ